MSTLMLALLATHQPTPTSPQIMTVKTVVTHNIDSRSAIVARTAHFNRTVRQAGLPGKVVSCASVIDLIDPGEPTVHTYGAICKIRFGRSEREYAICDVEDTAYPNEDDGQAALGLSYNEDRNWLADFTSNNCIEQR